MNSQPSKIARNIRLQEWAHMIQECNSRPADMTVSEWCNNHNITKCDYYYRMKMVRKACLEAAPVEAVQQAIVPVSVNLLKAKDVSSMDLNMDDAIELNIKGVQLKVTNQTSDDLLRKVLGVIIHVK